MMKLTLFAPLTILLLVFFLSQHHVGAAEENIQVDANGEVSSGGGAFPDIFKNILKAINSDHEKDSSVTNGKDDTSLDDIVSIARNMEMAAPKSERSITELFEHFKAHLDESTSMMKSAFAHIDFGKLTLASLWYYIEKIEETRTPSWKRRVHRYHKSISVDTILELHDALYLMQVAYLPTKKLIAEYVNNFRDGAYEVIDAVTTGNPTEPAHFIMIPKKQDGKKLGDIPREKSIAEFWNDITQKYTSKPLEIVLAIRGTGELGDIISDSMLNATIYRNGFAHDGIARAGKYITGRYIEEIRRLMEASGRDRVEVTLIGYSLGAGVAAIAAMELNDYDFIDAHSIGFGCPALLDINQSEETKSYITTVVTDSDVVSRMSGPTVANNILDIMSYDWTQTAMQDLSLWLDTIEFPIDKDGILAWANETLAQKYLPHLEKSQERIEQVLFPPGNCIHLWRNGAGWSGTYTPCSFFDSVEYSRTLLSDHLIEPGYHSALLGLAREEKNDLNFHFHHDLMALSGLV